MALKTMRALVAAMAVTAASLMAAQAQTGASCTAQPPASYGDAPQASIHSIDGLFDIASLCIVEGGRRLDWVDPSGEARRACLITPPNAPAGVPLPLLVWLHPSLFPQDSIVLTGIIEQMGRADLTGDPARRGFALLLPAGRDTEHFYPFPDNRGLGWDNWYRNFERGTPALNVDVATIDHFIAAAKAATPVDPKRVYLSGWSNGAAMAQLYALNTPGIAAAAVYSSPDPYRDIKDPCAQAPFATQLTPLMDIHNACDILGICQTGAKFHEDLGKRYPSLKQKPVIINSLLQPVQSCAALCANQAIVPGGLSIGTLNHLRWPVNQNDEIFAFLREHPLN